MLENFRTSFGGELQLTQAMRTDRQKSQFANYSRFILRFQFPDGFILQGVFRPLETGHYDKIYFDLSEFNFWSTKQERP